MVELPVLVVPLAAAPEALEAAEAPDVLVACEAETADGSPEATPCLDELAVENDTADPEARTPGRMTALPETALPETVTTLLSLTADPGAETEAGTSVIAAVLLESSVKVVAELEVDAALDVVEKLATMPSSIWNFPD